MAEHLSTKSPNLILFKPSVNDSSFYFMKKVGKMSCFHTISSKEELSFVHQNSKCPHCSNIGFDESSVFRTLSLEEEDITLQNFTTLALSSKENLQKLTRYEEWMSPYGVDPILLAKEIYFNNKYIFSKNNSRVIPHFGGVLIYDIKKKNIPNIFKIRIGSEISEGTILSKNLIEKTEKEELPLLSQYLLSTQFSNFLSAMLSEICINYEPYVEKLSTDYIPLERSNFVSTAKGLKDDFDDDKISKDTFETDTLNLSKNSKLHIAYFGLKKDNYSTVFLLSSRNESQLSNVIENLYVGEKFEVFYFGSEESTALDDLYHTKREREHNRFRQWAEIIEYNKQIVSVLFSILETSPDILKTLFKNFVHPDASSDLFTSNKWRLGLKKKWKKKGSMSTFFDLMSHRAFKDDYFEKYTISQYESLFYYYSMLHIDIMETEGTISDLTYTLLLDKGLSKILNIWTGALATSLILVSKSNKALDLRNIFVLPKFIDEIDNETGFQINIIGIREDYKKNEEFINDLHRLVDKKQKELFGNVKEENMSDYEWYYTIVFPNFFRYYILTLEDTKAVEIKKKATKYFTKGDPKSKKKYEDNILPYVLEKLDYCYSIFQGMCLVYAFLKRSPYGAIEELNWAIFLSWSGIYETASEDTDRSVKRGKMEK